MRGGKYGDSVMLGFRNRSVIIGRSLTAKMKWIGAL